MRRLVLILLMVFLPLQWSSAAVAACCLQELQANPALTMDESHHHHDAVSQDVNKTAAEKSKTADKHECGAHCLACHAHGAALLLTLPAFLSTALPLLPDSVDVTFLSDVLPDNLYRPPLAHSA